MSTIRFSDGMEFDLSGPLRIEERSDGLYVVGEGFLSAVDSIQDGQELIEEINLGQSGSKNLSQLKLKRKQ
jgi:CRISPR/Cas system CSM-associated protein Csm3 (group 7 of RAMP superfamily)